MKKEIAGGAYMPEIDDVREFVELIRLLPRDERLIPYGRLQAYVEMVALQVGYDRHSAQYLVDDMESNGFRMDDVNQGENLTPVIREFEGYIKDGNFFIPGNNLLRGHFLNVALKQNAETRKVRPVKIEQRARIDGFVSVIDAMTVRQKHWNVIGEYLKNEPS